MLTPAFGKPIQNWKKESRSRLRVASQTSLHQSTCLVNVFETKNKNLFYHLSLLPLELVVVKISLTCQSGDPKVILRNFDDYAIFGEQETKWARWRGNTFTTGAKQLVE